MMYKEMELCNQVIVNQGYVITQGAISVIFCYVEPCLCCNSENNFCFDRVRV